MDNIINQDELLNMLGVSKRRLKLMIITNGFPAIKLGGKYVFLESSVLSWLKSTEQPKSVKPQKEEHRTKLANVSR